MDISPFPEEYLEIFLALLNQKKFLELGGAWYFIMLFGASTFGNVALAPLTGHYHRIPRQTEMPPGLGVIADGANTHHTIFPTQRMQFTAFSDLFMNLPWTYAGKK